MVRIHPARPDDLPDLLALARRAGTGLTTLPDDPATLATRIAASQKGFAAPAHGAQGETYFMVLEDVQTGQVGGTCAIYAGVGLDRPFYTYRLLTLAQRSAELGVSTTARLLTLVNDYAGATEVGTLFLDPAFRRDGNGSLLARARYLLMAAFPQRFSTVVMAEMRGWQDAEGRSPFWDAVGRHFFKMPFPEADRASAIGDNRFIADLMPKFPLYVELLPAEAQAVIGKTHDATRPALALLEREGFRFANGVDIFDAGPCVEAQLQGIRTVRKSQSARVGAIKPSLDQGHPALICTESLDSFAVTRGRVLVLDAGFVALDGATATSLTVAPGDTIRFVLSTRPGE